MADVKISQLPAGTANANAVVPATNAAGTTTQKVTMGAIAALGGGPPAAHKSTHATGGTDAITPSDIGAVASNDARLTDSRTPTSHKATHSTGGTDALAASDIGAAAAIHAHGNVTSAGAIGTTANLPVITGASGVLQAGSFGSSANTFCQGNDSRLSDARTPTFHASTHQTGGADAIAPVIVTPASLSSSQNDYAPGVCDIIRLSSSTAIDITGLVAGTVDGALRLVINTNASGGSNITLKHESASSTAGNRFRSVTAADIVLLPDGGSVTLTYSNAISRWRIL